MLTDDAKSKLDDRHIDDKKLQAPDWSEIEALLSHADKLKIKCDSISDQLFLLFSLQVFCSLGLVSAFICLTFISWKHGIHVKDILNGNFSGQFNAFLIIVAVVFFLSIAPIELFLRKLRRRVRSDRRALDSIVGLLRENYYLMTKNFSELQKIQFEIRLCISDIETSTRKIPTSQRSIDLIHISEKLLTTAALRITSLIHKK
jgi:ABC-type multidrug transport system fused ATPase/permease subunit